MMNYEAGAPNPRFWVPKLLKDNFGLGDRLVETTSSSSDFAVQVFATTTGEKLFLLNKRNREEIVNLPSDVDGSAVLLVAPSNGDGPAAQLRITGHSISLQPFEVAVLTCRGLEFAEMMQQRITFQLRIETGMEAEYDETHRHVWPELLAEHESFGVTDYSIFRRGQKLFLYLRAPDRTALMEQLDQSDANRRWQMNMQAIFEPVASLQPGEDLAFMEEVFFLPGHSTHET